MRQDVTDTGHFDLANPIFETTATGLTSSPLHDDGGSLTVRMDLAAAASSGGSPARLLLLHHMNIGPDRIEVITFHLPASLSIRAAGGTPQSTVLGTVFPVVLETRIEDSEGNGVTGIEVTFSAPPGGATGTFPGGAIQYTGTSDAQGRVPSGPFTANLVGGNYVVTAHADGVPGEAAFSLQNELGAVFLPEREADAGGSVEIPVQLSAGGGIAELALTISFDADLLEVAEVGKGGLLTDHILVEDTETAGQIRVSLASPTSNSLQAGPGAVALISFDVSPAAPESTTTLSVSEVQAITVAGEDLPLDVSDGTLTIRASMLCLGDVNRDGVIDVSDPVRLFSYLFLSSPLEGPALVVADTNSDGLVNVLDVIRLLAHLFRGEPLPDCP